jgi:peptidoglycan/LPS O-acetylase OafA/YrhL
MLATRTTLPERNLDCLRALAVLSVVTCHVMVATQHAHDVATVLGRMGVLLFFVHTSLVLMGSLERGGSKPGWVRRFYVRRAFRIYPLAIATIVFMVVTPVPPFVPVAGRVTAFQAPSWPTIAANVALVQNLTGHADVLTVLWSLPIEVQMYLVLPLCFVIARRPSARGLGLAVLLTVLAGALVAYAPTRGLWRLSVALYGPCFLGGIMAYRRLRVGIPERFPAWAWLAFLVTAGGLFVALLRPWATEAPAWPAWIFCLTVGAAIPLFANLRASWITRAAATIATYSYGVYLLHVPALYIGLIVLRDRPTAVQWAVTIGLGVSLPVLAYKTIESPAVRFGQRVTVPSPPPENQSATLGSVLGVGVQAGTLEHKPRLVPGVES